MTKVRKCTECGKIRPLTAQHFRLQQGKPGFEGVCTWCRPVTVNELAARAVKKVKKANKRGGLGK